MILTKRGPKAIQDLKPGDFVYSEKGKPIRVKRVIYQGEKEVVDLCNNGTIYETSTMDHRWMALHAWKNPETPSSIRSLNEWTKHCVIARKWVKAPLGRKNEPHAYVLGAMLGNGCRTKRGRTWNLSCDNDEVPTKVSDILDLSWKRSHPTNFTYILRTKTGHGRYGDKIKCRHYDEWCLGKLSYEKQCDLSIIKTWNRRSLLEFVAGLMDTDGSIIYYQGEIHFRISMQSKTCIEAIQYALLALWQCKAQITIDNRPRYKHPIYSVGVKNILFNQIILKELDPYLVNPKRKYRPEFDQIKPNNGNPNHVGVTFKNKRIEKCWDIEVDSPTHLYLTATGLVTHNSNLFAEIMIEDIEENGYDCLYVAKSQKQARKIIWKKLAGLVRDQPGWKLRDSYLEATYKGGPSISVKGADLSADNLAGSGYRVIAADEFALWKNPQVVKEILVPMLADYQGQIMYGSTKRGKNHFFQLQKTALADPQKYYTDEATIFDNPFITPEGREIVLSEYDSETDPLYRQEILNEYVAFEGMAFAIPEETYITKRWDPADLAHSFHWRGMDHGYSPDPTAAVWIAYNPKFKYFLVYSEYKQTRLLIAEHAENIRNQEPYPIIDTVSDIDPQVMAEYDAIGLNLTPAAKSGKNPRILRLVTAMKNGKLKIASNCTELLEELQAYEWDQDGNDHLCFIAGTLITTQRGDIPIENVQLSDQVLTRKGWNQVKSAACTGVRSTLTLEFSNGIQLTCTPDHPIFTQNRGFVRADALTYEDIFYSLEEWLQKKKLSSKAFYLDVTPTQKLVHLDDILCAVRCTLNRVFDICIERFGRLIMGLFPMAGMSITKMEIASTMTFPTWNVSQEQSIKLSIPRKDLFAHPHKNNATFWKKLGLLPRNGMDQKRVLGGISFMGRKCLRIVRSLLRSASNARGHLSSVISMQIGQNSVQTNVEQKIEGKAERITKLESASNVAKTLVQTASERSKLVPENAVGLTGGKRSEVRTVYNLSVESQHEYFANGLLVSNCDALNYGFNNLVLPDMRKRTKDNLPHHKHKGISGIDHFKPDFGDSFPPFVDDDDED